MTVIECPDCGKSLKVNDSMAGKRVCCPGCKNPFVVPDAAVEELELVEEEHEQEERVTARPRRDTERRPPSPRPRAEEDEEDADRPRPRRRRQHDDDPDSVSFSSAPLVYGILACLLSCVPLIGALLGYLALNKANAEFDRLPGGKRARAARKQLRLAKTLGIVGICLSGVVFVVALVVRIRDELPRNDVAETHSTDTTQAEALQAAPAAGNPAAVGWGQVDPDRDCTITIQGTTLHVTVPPTRHDLSSETGQTNAPRVLQEVTGDFTVQVKVCGALQPRTAANPPGRVPFQSGGLLVWSDQGNYLRLERAALSRDGKVSSSALFEQRSNGLRTASFMMDIADQDMYLRLERRGEAFSAFVSSDGQHWQPNRRLNAAFPARVQVGVAVINAAQQPLQVRFEGWQLDKK